MGDDYSPEGYEAVHFHLVLFQTGLWKVADLESHSGLSLALLAQE
jgi:hypothetical protein